ncbi:MAG: hypothetical protein QXD89_00305 [Candidatus Aenigmatarchaeota archaeon]
MQVKEIEKGKIEKILERNYGCRINFNEFKILVNRKGKIFLFNENKIEENLLKIASYVGLYLGKLKRNGKIQLSTEGSQIVGPQAKKNIAVLNEENLRRYMEGLKCKWEKLINCEENNFILIKYENDFYGSGILRKEYIESLVPKSRRVMTEIRKI